MVHTELLARPRQRHDYITPLDIVAARDNTQPRLKTHTSPRRLSAAANFLYDSPSPQDRAKLLLVKQLIECPCSQQQLQWLLQDACQEVPDLAARLALLLKEDACFRQASDGTILLHDGVLLGRFVAAITEQDKLALCDVAWPQVSGADDKQLLASQLLGSLAKAMIEHVARGGTKSFAPSMACLPDCYRYTISGIQAGMFICKCWRNHMAHNPPAAGTKPYGKLSAFLHGDTYFTYNSDTESVEFDVAGLCGDGLLGLSDTGKAVTLPQGHIQSPCMTGIDELPLQLQQQHQTSAAEVLGPADAVQYSHAEHMGTGCQQQQPQHLAAAAFEQSGSDSDAEQEDILALLLSHHERAPGHSHLTPAALLQASSSELPLTTPPTAKPVSAQQSQLPAPYWPFAVRQAGQVATPTADATLASQLAQQHEMLQHSAQNDGALHAPQQHQQQLVQQQKSEATSSPAVEERMQQARIAQPATQQPQPANTPSNGLVASQLCSTAKRHAAQPVQAAALAAIGVLWPSNGSPQDMLRNSLACYMIEKGRLGPGGGRMINICQAGEHLQKCWRQQQCKGAPYSRLLPFLATCSPFVQLRAEPGNEQCVHAWLDVQQLAAGDALAIGCRADGSSTGSDAKSEGSWGMGLDGEAACGIGSAACTAASKAHAGLHHAAADAGTSSSCHEVANAVWPPDRSTPDLLKRQLAKHMLVAGTKQGVHTAANGDKVITLAAAGLFLSGFWKDRQQQLKQQGCAASDPPYWSLKTLFRGDPMWSVVPDSAKASTLLVTLRAQQLHMKAAQLAEPALTSLHLGEHSRQGSRIDTDGAQATVSVADVSAGSLQRGVRAVQTGLSATHSTMQRAPSSVDCCELGSGNASSSTTPVDALAQASFPCCDAVWPQGCGMAGDLKRALAQYMLSKNPGVVWLYGNRATPLWRAATFLKAWWHKQLKGHEQGSAFPFANTKAFLESDPRYLVLPNPNKPSSFGVTLLVDVLQAHAAAVSAGILGTCAEGSAHGVGSAPQHVSSANQLPSASEIGPGFEDTDAPASIQHDQWQLQLAPQVGRQQPRVPAVASQLPSSCHVGAASQQLVHGSSHQPLLPEELGAGFNAVPMLSSNHNSCVGSSMPAFAQLPGLLAAALQPHADDACMVRWWCAMAIVRAANPGLQLWTPSGRQAITADYGCYEMLLAQAGQVVNKLWSNQPDECPDAERPWLRPGMSLKVLLGGGDQNVLSVVMYNEKGGRKVVLDMEALMMVG